MKMELELNYEDYRVSIYYKLAKLECKICKQLSKDNLISKSDESSLRYAFALARLRKLKNEKTHLDLEKTFLDYKHSFYDYMSDISKRTLQNIYLLCQKFYFNGIVIAVPKV